MVGETTLQVLIDRFRGGKGPASRYKRANLDGHGKVG